MGRTVQAAHANIYGIENNSQICRRTKDKPVTSGSTDAIVHLRSRFVNRMLRPKSTSPVRAHRERVQAKDSMSAMVSTNTSVTGIASATGVSTRSHQTAKECVASAGDDSRWPKDTVVEMRGGAKRAKESELQNSLWRMPWRVKRHYPDRCASRMGTRPT